MLAITEGTQIRAYVPAKFTVCGVSFEFQKYPLLLCSICVSTKENKPISHPGKGRTRDTLVLDPSRESIRKMPDQSSGAAGSSGSGKGDHQAQEIASLRDDVGLLTSHISQLILLVGDLARKKEEPSDAGVGDAGRASEGIAAVWAMKGHRRLGARRTGRTCANVLESLVRKDNTAAKQEAMSPKR